MTTYLIKSQNFNLLKFSIHKTLEKSQQQIENQIPTKTSYKEQISLLAPPCPNFSIYLHYISKNTQKTEKKSTPHFKKW